jgi:hypothetical protein
VGINALNQYNLLRGAPAAFVPLETGGGSGTAGGHWKESVFNTELMTGYLNYGNNPLSKVSIASLADLGYKVDLTKADAYTLPASQVVSSLLSTTPSTQGSANLQGSSSLPNWNSSIDDQCEESLCGVIHSIIAESNISQPEDTIIGSSNSGISSTHTTDPELSSLLPVVKYFNDYDPSPDDSLLATVPQEASPITESWLDGWNHLPLTAPDGSDHHPLI